MIIGVPGEAHPDETLVALTPDVAGRIVNWGWNVWIESGAGEAAGFPDDQYEHKGCGIVADRAELFRMADVLVHVRGMGAHSESGFRDLSMYREGQIVIGQLGPYDGRDRIHQLAERGVTAFALELVPRISRAQSMDALTSMANIAGYKATILGAHHLPKLFPMMMTAAGTIRPANVFVLGAGVAGLQAIATAHRLGAVVKAYDIRPEVQEEVESLGAEFVSVKMETEETSGKDGYAREMDEAFYESQRQMMRDVLRQSDVVITTAAVPGKPAPTLLTDEMVEGMQRGAVIVDLAAATGGNCTLTRPDQVVTHQHVTILGLTNLPSTVPHHASQLYANNIRSFLDNLIKDGEPDLDREDEIIDSTMIIDRGTVHEKMLSPEASKA